MTDTPATRTDRIKAILAAALSPSELKVIDESERHRGHGGWREGGETHYAVEVVSAAFDGKTRLARQRLVMDALAPEFASGLHALSVTARAPAE